MVVDATESSADAKPGRRRGLLERLLCCFGL